MTMSLTPKWSFLQFEDPRDADDAIYGRDGYDFDGYRLRVGGPCMNTLFVF